jgi:hypothetical protein
MGILPSINPLTIHFICQLISFVIQIFIASILVVIFIKVFFVITVNLVKDLWSFDLIILILNTILSINFHLYLELLFFDGLIVNYIDFLKHFKFFLRINALLKTICVNLYFIVRFQEVLCLNPPTKGLFSILNRDNSSSVICIVLEF